MPNLSDDIETAATSPVSATADGVSVTQRSIDEMIAADRYARATESAAQPTFGLRFIKLKMPGSQ